MEAVCPPCCWPDCCPDCDWLELLELLELLLLELLLELLVDGKLGELGMPDEVLGKLGEELGMLGEELGILGEELGEPDGLGMLGIPLDEELEVLWQPASTMTVSPSKSAVQGLPRLLIPVMPVNAPDRHEE